MALRVSIVGGSGYTGAELIRLLSRHPDVVVADVCAGRSAGERLEQVFPHFAGVVGRELAEFDAEAVASHSDVVFVALPHGHSAKVVAELRDRGTPVVDLSADFRLHNPELYREWYGEQGPDGQAAAHPRPELLGAAVYGLPELHRAAIAQSSLVAAPGCYPTAALLALAPLLRGQLVAPQGIIVDAKSGVTGAGRALSLATHFSEIGEGIRAYKLAGTHRHTVEIEQELSLLAGEAVRVTFSPHLVPMARGILATVYARPTEAARPEAEYGASLARFYRGEPFVTVRESGLPDTSHVRASNRAHVAVRYDGRANLVVAVCAIDNLVKGASGQAIQCMNLMMGLEERRGLDQLTPFP